MAVVWQWYGSGVAVVWQWCGGDFMCDSVAMIGAMRWCQAAFLAAIHGI